ncbi:MAG: preprotein translocase subunit SecG [Blastocatellia bacterium]|nr:preprotein translocase subunit SecG [Blastocatellia bacterium]
MEYVLYTIFFLSCIILIAAVLLQPGKTDAGALFTSSVSSSALAPRGTATILSKITITAAITFMVSALMLSMPALTGNVSVLSSNPDGTTTESNSNANVATDTNSNTATPDANAASPAAPPAAPATGTLVPDTGNGTQVKDEPKKDEGKKEDPKKDDKKK